MKGKSREPIKVGPKSHEIELGHIPDWHIWDLKSATLQFLLPRLQAFKRFHVDGKAQGIPIWVAPYCEREQPSEIELSQKWIEILDQMILGFEVIATPSSFLTIDLEEQSAIKERGFKLFAEFFEHLWD